MTLSTTVPLMRIGFLGAGLIATYHSKSLRRSGAEQTYGVTRAGVYDPDTQRAHTFAAASGHTECASEAEVLDGCDVVYICTWTSEHHRLLIDAVERGLHVFCEKPLAFTGTEAAEMAAAAQRAGVAHQIGLVLRRSPAYVWAKHLVDDPTAGKVMTVVFRDDQFIPVQGQYASTWRGDKSKAGAGTLLEHSIHDVDMLRYLVGELRSVSGTTANFHGIDGIEDVATASIAFIGGATGTLTSVWHDNLARPSLRRVEIFCERRHIVVEGDDWFGPVSSTDSDGTATTWEGQALRQLVLDLTGTSDNPDGEFIRAIAEARPATPGLDTAVAAHHIVDAIYASAAAGGNAVTL